MIAPMRRVTVNVPSGRMEEVIAFYRDVLGMRVFFQNIFETKEGQGGEAVLLGFKIDVTNHIVSLQQGENVSGMIGLHEFLRPRFDVKPFEKGEGLPYPVVFVFSVQNIEAIHDRARKAGATILVAPHAWEIPGKGVAKGMHFLDPLGINVELTEFSSDVQNPAPSVSPLRRVTIPVARGKLAESKRFYEEVMGMKVFYDSDIRGEGKALGLGNVDYRAHLTSLQLGDSVAGMIGLMEYMEPEMHVQPFSRTADGLFPVAFAFVTDDLEAHFAKAQALGARVVSAPITYDIPNRGRSTGTTFVDPNGVLISLTQLARQ